MREHEEAAEQVGARVVIARERATVRYVGPVAGQKGVWAGVEWDDPSRGKHDGSTGGVKYFQCVSALPTAGSFVRIEKVHFGNSVVDAVKARYADQEATGDAYVQTASNRKVLVQLVGEEQVRQHQRQTGLLTTARLVGQEVSTAGKAEELAALLPQLGELDLTDNLLASWRPVAALLQALPQLHTVVLTHNRLALERQAPCAYPTLTNLRSLVLNSCGVTWQQIAELQASLPKLEELHACGNSISSLSAPEDASSSNSSDSTLVSGFDKLQILDLENNSISWQQALRLSALPSLTRLQLSNNPITEVSYPSATLPVPAASPHSTAGGTSTTTQPTLAAAASPTTAAPAAAAQAGTAGAGALPANNQCAFVKLSTLLLGQCQISSWRCVDQLARFPSLADLRLSGNPLLADAKSGGRFEVIGRVGALTMLNGADIGPRERRDSDLRYLQNAMADLEEAAAAAGAAGAANARAAAAQAHPRLQALITKYGYVSAASNKAMYQGSALSSTMCELVLKHGAGSSKKKLPRTTTVAALKLLCERLFKVKADRQALLLADPDTGAVEDIAQDDSKELAFYNIQPGVTLEVCDDDPEARRLAAAAQQEQQRLELQARMAVQLREGDFLRKAAEQ